MDHGMAEDERLVYLRSEHHGSESRYLTARRVLSGDLWIEGQDLGPCTEIVAPDGEYEWVWVVAADEVNELLGTLDAPPDTDVLNELAARWTGEASYELERRLREGGLAKLHVV